MSNETLEYNKKGILALAVAIYESMDRAGQLAYLRDLRRKRDEAKVTATHAIDAYEAWLTAYEALLGARRAEK